MIRGLIREDLSDAFQPLPGRHCWGLEELQVRRLKVKTDPGLPDERTSEPEPGLGKLGAQLEPSLVTRENGFMEGTDLEVLQAYSPGPPTCGLSPP